MPVSKRRKPKNHETSGMPKAAARAHFKQLAQMDGQIYNIEKRTISDAADAENPFSNAWVHSHETNTGYTEGIVWRDDTGWITHAWCTNPEDDSIIEVTDTYDQATQYKGWVLKPKDMYQLNGGPDQPPPTSSLLEKGLTRSGGQYTELVGRLRKNKN